MLMKFIYMFKFRVFSKIKFLYIFIIIFTIIFLFQINQESSDFIKFKISYYSNIKLVDRLNEKNSPRVKHIFCFVTSEENSLNTKAKLMYESWVSKCDNHVFISTIPRHFYIPNRKITHQAFEIFYDSNMKLLQPENYTEDKYNKLTDKIYLTLLHIYKHYNDYDYYLKADDDTYIFINNLRSFLKNKNSSNTPLTYGYNYKQFVDKGYHSGGAGYVLTNSALKKLGEKLSTDYKFCPNSGTEDIDVAKCARMLNIYPARSTDDLGRERFHPLSITRHYTGNFSSPVDWIHWLAENPPKKVLIISFLFNSN